MLIPSTGTLADYNNAILGMNATHARVFFPVQNVTFNDDNISAEGGITLTQMLNGETDLFMGKAVCSEVVIHLLKGSIPNGFDWTEEFRLDFGVEINGSTNWVTVGHFTGTKPERSKRVETIAFTAHDRMTKFDVLADDFLATITYPTTAGDIFHDLCAYLNLNYVSGDEDASVMALSYTESPFVNGITCRTLLAMIAEMNCCYARMSAGGDVKLSWFEDKTSVYSVNDGNYYGIDIDESDTQAIGFVRISSTEDESAGMIYPLSGSGAIYEIVDNPMILSLNTTGRTTVMSAALTRLNAICPYTPATVNVVGNWMVETGDIIEVLFDGGSSMNMPIFVRTMQWNGGCADLYGCTGNMNRDALPHTAREQYEEGGKLSRKYTVQSGVDITDEGITVSGGKWVKINSGGVLDVSSENFTLSSTDHEMICEDNRFGWYGVLIKTPAHQIGKSRRVGIVGNSGHLAAYPLSCGICAMPKYDDDTHYTIYPLLFSTYHDDASQTKKRRDVHLSYNATDDEWYFVPGVWDSFDQSTCTLGTSTDPWSNAYISKFSGSGVYNDLDQTAQGFVLDARQGKVLNDAVAGKLDVVQLTSVSSNSSRTYDVANNSKLLVICFGASTAKEAWIVNVTNTGGVSTMALGTSSVLSTSTASGKLTISNTGNNGAQVWALVLTGSISDAT